MSPPIEDVSQRRSSLPPPIPSKPETLRSRQSSTESKSSVELNKAPPLPERPARHSATIANRHLSEERPAIPPRTSLTTTTTTTTTTTPTTTSTPPPTATGKPTLPPVQHLDDSQTIRTAPMLASRLMISRNSRNALCRLRLAEYDLLLGATPSQVMGWDLCSGEVRLQVNVGSDIITSLIVLDQYMAIVGMHSGSLLLFQLPSGTPSKTLSLGSRPITHLLRWREELWAVDEAGWVHFWCACDPNGADLTADRKMGVARIVDRPHVVHVTADGTLWVCSGTLFEVYCRNREDGAGLILRARFECEPDLGLRVGVVTAMASIGGGADSSSSEVITAHEDGMLVIWRTRECSIKALYRTGVYKIQGMLASDDHHGLLWLALSTGKMAILDLSTATLLLEWTAHLASIIDLVAPLPRSKCRDPFYRPLISLCESSGIGVWDANLQHHHIQRSMRQGELAYCQYGQVRIALCSWNVDAQRPPTDEEFWREWIRLADEPDLVVLGLQEIVDLGSKSSNARLLLLQGTSKNANSPDPEDAKARQWTEAVLGVLAGREYVVIAQQNLVGLAMVIIASKACSLRIRHVAHGTVKTGLGGYHGNKGAILMRMLIDDTSLCLINCHLAAGHNQVAARNTDAATILKTGKLPPLVAHEESFYGGGGELIADYENCILFGDLNYRLAMVREEAERLVMGAEFESLWRHDQLRQQLAKTAAHPLASFEEAPLDFAPTYKYDRGMSRLDTSEKRRVPAWCDRILVRSRRSKQPIRIQNYRSHDRVLVSDHRPISAMLHLPTKHYDPLKRELFRLDLQKEWIGRLRGLREGAMV